MLNKLLGLKNVIIQKKLKRAIGVYIINKLNKTNTMKCIEQNEQWELVGQEEQMEQIEHTEQDQHAEQGEHSEQWELVEQEEQMEQTEHAEQH